MRTAPSQRELLVIQGLSTVEGFADKVRELRAEIDEWCGTGPYYVRIADGRRDLAAQFEKWKVGRVEVSPDPAPWGTWEPDGTGKIITNAPPGSSAHETGLAVDFGIIDSRGTRSSSDDKWAPSYVRSGAGVISVHPAWKRLGELAKARGLQTGLHWKRPWDFGHVEHPRWAKLAAAVLG